MIADLTGPPCPEGLQGSQRVAFEYLERAEQLGGGQSPIHRHASRAVVGNGDEDTESLNYTTELYAYIRKGAPKSSRIVPRKMGGYPKSGIYADRERGASVAGLGISATSSELSRIHEITSTGIEAGSKESHLAQPEASLARAASKYGRAVNPRRRVSAVLAERQAVVEEKAAVTRGMDRQGITQQHTVKRKPRRMPIYIPSDDTTIQTIHPGMISRRGQISEQHHSSNGILPLLNPLDGQSEHVEGSRKSAKGPARVIATRRVPLQTVSTFKQETTYKPDRFGQGGGKENIPPASLEKPLSMSKPKRKIDTGQDYTPGSTRNRGDAMFNNIGGASCGSTTPSNTTCPREMERHAIFEGSRKLNAQLNKQGFRSTTESHYPVPTDHHAHTTWKRACKQTLPDLEKPLGARSKQDKNGPYPLLSDVCLPEIYEENWLAHQEAAITQLVNCLFESFEDAKWTSGSAKVNLTRELVHIYQERPFPMLYQHIQASLLHGALRGPKGTTGSISRLESDVGLRQEFLDLWTGTYESAPLQAAAEAVIGRQLSEASKWPSASIAGRPRGAKQKLLTLKTFLDVFLIQNQDISPMKYGVEDIPCSYRTDLHSSTGGCLEHRSIHRSLLLILLLDKVKHTKTTSSCLFLPTSPHKSSVSVLNELTKLLLPSVGDVHRVLRHLGYVLHHEQHPLQEYRYRIVNLATDLRDGVRLTSLVELLLFSSAAASRFSDDATIMTPDGELSLDTLKKDKPWALSSHLKVPCTAKSQKTHNVQIALDALSGVAAVNGGKGLRAVDIVNGHREKTVGLLWALLSQFGLSVLVDWKELEKETRRHQKRSPEHPTDYEAEPQCQESSDKHASALVAWAGAIARLHRLSLKNTPTAFANGMIFEKIVDEYAIYLQDSQKKEMKIRLKSTGLETKLSGLGCNRYFGKLPFPQDVPRSSNRRYSIALLWYVPPTDTHQFRFSADHITLVTSLTVISSWQHSPFLRHACSAPRELAARRS